MGELLHHTLNECRDEGSGVFRDTKRTRKKLYDMYIILFGQYRLNIIYHN